jgi:hypothetical protein
MSSNPAPDFIFVPIRSQIFSNPWGCTAPDLLEGIRWTTKYIRALAESIGDTDYPRIVVPLATLRSNFEKEFLVPEIMEELKDKVVFVSIETAPKSQPEVLQYLIDVPCKSARIRSTIRD